MKEYIYSLIAVSSEVAREKLTWTLGDTISGLRNDMTRTATPSDSVTTTFSLSSVNPTNPSVEENQTSCE